MAEIFAAVASGAGLVSLAIQLLESSRKLKGLYDANKDAPRHIKDLCFDLETVSLQLRQLEQHRHHDRLDTQLLDQCIAQCERRTEKIRDTVDDMARYIRRSAAFGKLYAAFKEPEVEKLLDELERAKSSLSLTYLAYCQTWNMRNAASHESTLRSYGDVLALQQMQLGSIQQDISDGNARLYDQLGDLKTHRTAIKGTQIFHEPQEHVARSSGRRYVSTKKRNLLQFQLPWMAWLTGRTWEFAMCESESLWTWNLHPVSYRPPDLLAFRYVREGNIPAVEKLLRARELSIWDVTMNEFSEQVTLLEIAVEHRQVGLFDYLLTRFHSLRSDEHLHTAALQLNFLDFKQRGYFKELSFKDVVFKLLVDKFGMDVDVIDASPRVVGLLHDNFDRLGEFILSHQSVDFASWPLQQRFNTAMRLQYSTPLDFQRTVGLPVSIDLAQLHDEHLGNALHWAAKAWYKKAYHCDSESYTDHQKFVFALLKSGALLHALDVRGRTPLTCILDSGYHGGDYELWLPMPGANDGCAVQAALWGKVISEAGVSLPEYVAQENAILAARDIHNDIRVDRVQDAYLSRFVLSEQQILQLEVTVVPKMDIWEFRPPPGLFLESHEDCSTIIWPPSVYNNDRTCWQKTSSRKLRSKPFIWTKSHEHTGLDRNESDRERIFDALFKKSHDDHSALALLMGRDIRRRAGDNRHTRHRSASMPPLRNAYLHHKNRYRFSLFDSRFGLPGKELVFLDLHKCLFDSQWGFAVPYEHYLNCWRACMNGCQGRADYVSEFWKFLKYIASEPKRTASERERIGRIVEIG